MAKRSLQASPTGIHKAKHAFALKGWTQENLAGEINIKTRQPIWRFFTGQPVDRYIFLEICTILDLDCREIAAFAPADFVDRFDESEALSMVLDTDGLVKQVRSLRFDKIQDQCGIIQMLDVNRPTSLEQIYIDVNVLEEISSQRRLAIADFQNIQPQQYERVGVGAIERSQISGMSAIEKYSKLRVLGKPGAGKTTFLQHLAMQCNHGRVAGKMVPVFITLRNFVEECKASPKFSLLNYIIQEFAICGISDSSVVETLLQAGRFLLILDGMDEILNQDSNAMVNEIRKFSETYHKNRFVASCRIASSSMSLRGFTDVEIAPFNQIQISNFAQKWFAAYVNIQINIQTNIQTNSELAKTKSQQFIQGVNEPANWQFSRMVTTPLFLHLACWIFNGEVNRQVNGQEQFPIKRNEFYKEGLDVLLERWDEARGIKRDEVYPRFLLPQKLKLLSQLAAVTFENGQYFFTQEVIEQHISDYLQELPNATTEPEEIQQQSNAILRAIESQHGLLTERSRGIFSFSYLFQEYFTARKIVASYNLQALTQLASAQLEGLVSNINNSQWREIFILTTAMLNNPDHLIQLMRQKIDGMITDAYIQEFLNWQLNYISNNGKSKTPIHYDWHFSPDQEQILKCYYQANQLLLDCLHDNPAIALEIRQEIEANILLPFQETNHEANLSNFLKPNHDGINITRPRTLISNLLPSKELASHLHRKYA